MATLMAGTTQGTRFGERRDPMTGCPGTSDTPKPLPQAPALPQINE